MLIILGVDATELAKISKTAFILSLSSLVIHLTLLIIEIFCGKSKNKEINKFVHLNN
jgi:hypothetical protein